MTMHSPILPAIVCLLLLQINLVHSQNCYWPDGSQADSVYKPCANGRGSCCYFFDDNHHDLCYDNGFCFSLFFGYNYRGACTDSAFGSGSGCAVDCLDVSSAQMSACGDFACCHTNTNVGSCCSDATNTFIWNNATLLPRADLAGTLATTTVTAATASTTFTVIVTASSATTSRAAASSSSGPSVTASPCPQSKDVALGAGLGVPLGLSLLAIAILSWMLLRRPKQPAHTSTYDHGHPPAFSSQGVAIPHKTALEADSSLSSQGRFREVSELEGRR